MAGDPDGECDACNCFDNALAAHDDKYLTFRCMTSVRLAQIPAHATVSGHG
jgi:hypothetical protein